MSCEGNGQFQNLIITTTTKKPSGSCRSWNKDMEEKCCANVGSLKQF